MYGTGGEPLTPHERSRLRAGVSPAALESFLVATAGAGRRTIIVYFAREMLVDDLAEIDPDLAAEWTPPPPDMVTPDGSRFLPHVSFDLQVEVTDPELRILWSRIESRGGPDGLSDRSGNPTRW